MQAFETETRFQETKLSPSVPIKVFRHRHSLPLRKRIVAIAIAEQRKWNTGGRKSETDPQMRPILADYWLRGVGQRISDRQLASPAFQAKHPWSAAFISWVVRQA